MNLKFPEGLTHFYDGSGNEHKPDAKGQVNIEHLQTIREMLRAGFTAVEARSESLLNKAKEEVEKLEEIVVRFFHHETGEEMHSKVVLASESAQLAESAKQAVAIGAFVILKDKPYVTVSASEDGTQVRVAPAPETVQVTEVVHADTGEHLGQAAGEARVGNKIMVNGALHEVVSAEGGPAEGENENVVRVRPVEGEKKEINDTGTEVKVKPRQAPEVTFINAVHDETGEPAGQVAGNVKVGDKIVLNDVPHEVVVMEAKAGSEELVARVCKVPINDEGVQDN